MECLYVPELDTESSIVVLPDDEARHARVLRMREGEACLLSNGRGICAEAVVQRVARNEIVCRVLRTIPQYAEHPYRIVVALGILAQRERLEFAVEKAVELGAHDFVPLLTEYSQSTHIKAERLQSKARAAMKQAHRSCLTTIHDPISLQGLFSMLPAEARIIVADAQGIQPQSYSAHTICICVGSEGGWSPEEYRYMQHDPRVIFWKLAPSRLRAETAVVSGISTATLFHT
ncbi:MAG: 16S rRNA (uracil(1498)-N(3))-methyltransferase [Bacteroidota bacterium]|nr:16S rRNA (uracil(1498)-N(3))-methyltransferase [Candidatus Kapabacteria bacterium]MDW8221030.1 16S rRNA (uracil(1498)-N(3))-methyltransferase [Bacteroidota bacterium]